MFFSHEFLQALTIVLCVAALTTVVFQRLRQPVILGYILAGLMVGPHTSFPLVANSNIVQTLSEIGVILVMFSLGLEFSLRKLADVGIMPALAALFETSLMMWIGFNSGQFLGWSTMESVFLGAIIAISSTTIVVKAFQEQGVTGKLREFVVGILIMEDLIAIVLLATLTAIATGSGLAAKPLAITVGKLMLFLVGLMIIGMLIIPRAIRMINRLKRPETTIVANIGICIALALLADAFGYSVALGAFLAGSLVAESGEAKPIERMVEPIRDIFAAIFFVSVGMMIDPVLIIQYWPIILLMTFVVMIGKVSGISAGAFFTGNSLHSSIQSGMSLAQIGEFSFIIAGLGISLKATGAFLYPVAIAVSAITTLTTPWLIRASGPVTIWVDRLLPKPLQTFSVLYGTWIEGMRSAPKSKKTVTRVRRLTRYLIIDASVFTAIAISYFYARPPLLTWTMGKTGMSIDFASWLLMIGVILLSLPFFFGAIRVARRLGKVLAEIVLPTSEKEKTVDMADAPRRLLVITLEIIMATLVGVPMLALTIPFLPMVQGVSVAAGFIVLLGIAFWRSATNLQGHVQAGTEVIAQALARQSKGHANTSPDAKLKQVTELLPGLGIMMAIKLEQGSPAIGKTLAQLNLRALTGASVLAIIRNDKSEMSPSPTDLLQENDLLALTGKQEAIDAAKVILTNQ